MTNRHKVILDLCSGTGNWSEPYVKANYTVKRYELRGGNDVRLFKKPAERIHGILAAPPCQHFSSAGAQYWEAKGNKALLDGLSIVDACFRIIFACSPRWWALENPPGRLREYLGGPQLIFNPCDYGATYTKRTLLWGNFNMPIKTPRIPIEFCPGWGKGSNRPALRAATSPEFAHAFFEANP